MISLLEAVNVIVTYIDFCMLNHLSLSAVMNELFGVFFNSVCQHFVFVFENVYICVKQGNWSTNFPYLLCLYEKRRRVW